MIKTQVQIPDHLYTAAKRVAADYEMSFAEVVRRGLERVTQEYASKPKSRNWAPPKPEALGCYPLSNEELKALAQDDDPRL